MLTPHEEVVDKAAQPSALHAEANSQNHITRWLAANQENPRGAKPGVLQQAGERRRSGFSINGVARLCVEGLGEVDQGRHVKVTARRTMGPSARVG